jgi:hypothetical protein
MSLLCSGLLDNDKFSETRHTECSGFLEFLVANNRECFDDALDVPSRKPVRLYSVIV